MKIHEVKCSLKYFEAVILGVKPFEIRENDRDYFTGEILVLKEWDEIEEAFTGRSLTRVITYMTDFEQKPGWVVLGLSHNDEIDLLSLTTTITVFDTNTFYIGRAITISNTDIDDTPFNETFLVSDVIGETLHVVDCNGKARTFEVHEFLSAVEGTEIYEPVFNVELHGKDL